MVNGSRGAQPERLFQVGHSLLRLTVVSKREADRAGGSSEVRIKIMRGPEMTDGFIGLAGVIAR